MNGQKYADRLYNNIIVITEIQADDYPALYQFLHERSDAKLKRIVFLLETAQRIRRQEHDTYGYWYIMPYSRLAVEGKEIAKSNRTWQTTITLFAAMGLLARKIPTSETANTPYERAAVQYAQEHGNRHAAEFISFPEYSKRQLKYIEHKAKLWYEKDGNLQDWSKASVIDIFGSATANRVYNDERVKPRYKTEAEEHLQSVLSSILETKRYTTRDELIQAAALNAAEGQSAEAIEQRQKLYVRTWERASKKILRYANAIHKRPTDKEKAEYGLNTNGWIITGNC